MVFVLVVLPAVFGVVKGVSKGVEMIRAGRAFKAEPKQYTWPATSIPVDEWEAMSEADKSLFRRCSTRWNSAQEAGKRVVVGPLMVSERDVQERLSPEGRRIYMRCAKEAA